MGTIQNMAHFNEVVEDHPGVGYYSLEIECDGMMSTDDVKWGNYMMTFEQDHFEVIGMKPEMKAQCPNLITDNLRVDEIRWSNFKERNPTVPDELAERADLHF